MSMRTRTLGGDLLVIKNTNDCVTIARGKNSKPEIQSIEGDWTSEELDEACELWWAPEGREARNR